MDASMTTDTTPETAGVDPAEQLPEAELAAIAASVPNIPTADLIRALAAVDMLSLDVTQVANHLRLLLGAERATAMIETHQVDVGETAVSGQLRLFVCTPTRLIQLIPSAGLAFDEESVQRTAVRVVPRAKIVSVNVDIVTRLASKGQGDYLIAGFITGAVAVVDTEPSAFDPDSTSGHRYPMADVTIIESADYVDTEAMDRVMAFVATASS